MRVTLFIARLGPGGAEKVAIHLANGLADRDMQTDLLAIYKTPHAAQLSLVSGAAFHWLYDAPRAMHPLQKLYGHMTRFREYLRKNRPDIVITFGPPQFIATLGCRLFRPKTKVLATLHCTPSVYFHINPAGILPQLANFLGLHMAHAIVGVSQGVADDASRYYHLPRRRIQVLHNPVITADFLEPGKGAPPHPWLAPGGIPVVLAVGTLYPRKDHALLLRAFAKVRSQKECRLMILGEGTSKAMLEQLAVELGIERDFVLPGVVADPQAYMCRAALFVLSSRAEGLPNVLIEALACGAPIVSTDCPSGPSEILENGAYGVLVPVGDVDAMAKAMLQALSGVTPCTREERIARGREFLVETAAGHYHDLLCSLQQTA